MRLLLFSALLGVTLTACFEDAVQGGGDDPSRDSGVQRDARIAVSDASRVVSSDPEGTGATLTASKSQVCPGECVELLATPGEGAGAVSYRWANELTQGAGPVQVCPQIDTTYEVAIRHEEGTVGEFSAPASEVSRSVAVTVGGDCQVHEPVRPDVHDSAEEQCRAQLVVGPPSERQQGLLGVPARFTPALVHLLSGGGVRLASTHWGTLEAAPFMLALESEYGAGFVVDLDANCRAVAAFHLPPQGKSWLDFAAFAVDARGNNVVAGRVMNGDFDLGNGIVLAGGLPEEIDGRESKPFLAKLDSQGHALWAKNLPEAPTTTKLGVDGAGNIVLLSALRQLSKHAPDGALLWSQPMPNAVHLAVGADGQIALAEFLPEPGSLATYPPQVANAVLLDGDGKLLWQRSERVHDDSVLSSWSVVVAIGTNGHVVLRSEVLPSRDYQGNLRVASAATRAYDRNGELLWRETSAPLHQRSFEGISGLTVDRWGQVASVSSFSGPLQVGATRLDNELAEDDFYVSFADASGRPRWGFALGSAFHPLLMGLDSDDAGNVVFAAAPSSPASELVVIKLRQ